EKLTDQTLGNFISDESLPVFYNFHEKLLSNTGRQICELKLLNSEKWVQIESTCFEDGGECRAVMVDISDRKRISELLHARLRISEAADTYNLDDLLQKALDEAEALTGSQIGFVHFLQEDQKTLNLQIWSSNTLKHMYTAEGKDSHYPVEEAGVWAECVYTRKPVIHNDYASLPASRRKGLPEGHAPVQRELVVPILRNDLIVMIMGVGNKAEDYVENDLYALEQLASLTWDIIQRKQAEDALKLSERKYRLLHESMIDGFVSVDMNGNILDCNDIYLYMLGYSREELTQLTYFELTPEKWHAAEADIVENQIIKRGYSDVYEKEYIRKDGTIFPVELRTVLLRDEAGNPMGMWAIARNITERKYDELALEAANIELQTALLREQQLARTDPLTGVHNRRHLYELAEHELQVAARYERSLSVIMFDIDHFKIINDTFGHKTGDQMLTFVIDTACAELRSADVIGRYGGEEFIILLPMTTAQQASQVAERIRSNVSALQIPTPKGKATVTLSIGVVELKHAASRETVEEIFRRADEAMYAAKQAGRNRIELG
ncbi:MAG: diguanylate cyclase, partial [Anaerolineales bacterium]|nr:diguanylate cyclase [Anaerolineales bacterium]